MLGGGRYEMVGYRNPGDGAETRMNVSPTSGLTEEDSALELLTHSDRIPIAMTGIISPDPVLSVRGSSSWRPRKGLKASIWLKLTLFIGILVWKSYCTKF